MKRIFLSLAVLASTTTLAYAANHAAVSQAHAPVGVSGAELFHDGDISLSYNYNYEYLSGLRDNSGHRRGGTLVGVYTLIPQNMSIETHTIDFTYGVGENMSVSAQLPYISKKLEMYATSDNRELSQSSSGLGDFTIEAQRVFTVSDDKMHQFVFGFGLGAPTGSTNEKDDYGSSLFSGREAQLPYAMQLGSGSIQAIPALTYLGAMDKNSWGFQGKANFYIGKNSEGYRLGDSYHLSGWLQRHHSARFSTSLRLKLFTQEQINGIDTSNDIRPTDSPLADSDQSGGTWLDVGLGAQYIMGKSRLGLEFSLPVHENLRGTDGDRTGAQLSKAMALTATLQLNF